MVGDYISREAALKVAATVKVPGLPQWNSAVGYTMEKLQSIPAADVVEVRHGHFGKHTSPFTAPCSECGTSMNTYWHYCPNCGVKMDGGQEE